jgi:hypothetical protein
MVPATMHGEHRLSSLATEHAPTAMHADYNGDDLGPEIAFQAETVAGTEAATESRSGYRLL